MRGEDLERLYHNGTIHYFSQGKWRTTESLFVKNGRVAGLGISVDGADSIDLQGQVLFPGFVDSHCHLISSGLRSLHADFSSCKSEREFFERLNETAAISSDWILGGGWDQTLWEPRPEFPNAANNPHPAQKPCFIVRVDGHAAFANSLALKKAGITKETPDPRGGMIVKDSSGNLTGLLVDKAMDLVSSIVPPATETQKIQALLEAQKLFLRSGITSCHDAGLTLAEFELIQKMRKQGTFRIDVHPMIYIQNHREFLEVERYCSEHPSERPKAIKVFADGALGSRGAAFLKPYCDDPENSGLLFYSDEELQEICKRAAEAAFQVCVHAIGDRANRQVLDAFETASPKKDLRWRIEHAQHIAPEDIPRFSKLNVIASQQPIHCTSDMRFATARLGQERCAHGAYPWKSLWDSKTLVSFGSDAPIEDPCVLSGLHAAITRRGWHTHECLNMERALMAYTVNGAQAAFKENEHGTLELESRADFVVIDKDLLMCEASEILKAQIVSTALAGEFTS